MKTKIDENIEYFIIVMYFVSYKLFQNDYDIEHKIITYYSI